MTSRVHGYLACQYDYVCVVVRFKHRTVECQTGLGQKFEIPH